MGCLGQVQLPGTPTRIVFNWPIFPLRTSSQARRNLPPDRCWVPNWNTTPLCLHGLAHGLRGAEAPADRLLAVHVLALPDRLQGHQRMPVIGRGDLHGVDVLAGHQLAEILVGRAVLVVVELVDRLLGLVPLGLVHVADGHDLDLGIPAEGPHVAHALDAQADAPQHHAVRRRHRARLAQGRRRHDRGKPEDAGQRGGLLEELPAADGSEIGLSFSRHKMAPFAECSVNGGLMDGWHALKGRG